MKISFSIACVVLLAGCSSTSYKAQNLIIEKEVHAMSRNEVIDAVRECETSGLRAAVVYARRRINNVPADIVVDVNCAPRYAVR
jgi:hypothetical protein